MLLVRKSSVIQRNKRKNKTKMPTEDNRFIPRKSLRAMAILFRTPTLRGAPDTLLCLTSFKKKKNRTAARETAR